MKSNYRLDFNGKVAIVTGAASGIGLDTAKVLSKLGVNLVISDVSPITTILEQLEINQNIVTQFACDVTNEEETIKLAKYTVEKFGKVDYLIHCAGILNTGGIEQTSLEEWERVLKVNLTGTFLVCKSIFPIMKRQNKGKIVAIGSVAGKSGGISSGIHYVASKGGVHSLLKGLAQEGAPYGVLVNGVAPGPVKTNMTKGINYYTESFPIKRLGEPEDIVGAIIYLISDMSNWVTGQILDVNGGMRM